MRTVPAIVGLTLLLVTLATPVQAQIHLKVHAGDADRVNAPMEAAFRAAGTILPQGADLEPPYTMTRPARLTAKDGAMVNAQLTIKNDGQTSSVTALWVEPMLKAGQTRDYELALLATTPKGYRFETADGGLHRDLFFGDTPVIRHAYLKYDPADHANTYKHFHHVYGQHGEGFITKGPGGKYTHHRGLYIGWSKTSDAKGRYDFWHCRNDVAVRHREYVADNEMVGPVAARTTSIADWTAKDGRPVVIEKRTVTAWRVSDGVTLLDFNFELTAADGDVKLHGDPQHAGFQFRPVDSVVQTKATFIRPASASGGKGDVWQTTPWCVSQFKVQGNPYVVMHMDHPANPGSGGDKPKTVYSTRNYGRFGAYAPHDLKAGQPLKFQYRIMVLDGAKNPDVSVKRFDAEHAQFVKPAKIEAKWQN